MSPPLHQARIAAVFDGPGNLGPANLGLADLGIEPALGGSPVRPYSGSENKLLPVPGADLPGPV